jgi:hypothetical protein
LQWTYDIERDLAQHIEDIFFHSAACIGRKLYDKLFHLITKACIITSPKSRVGEQIEAKLQDIVTRQTPFLLYMHTQHSSPHRYQELHHRLNSPWSRVYNLMYKALKRLESMHCTSKQVRRKELQCDVPWWVLGTVKRIWDAALLDSILVLNWFPLPSHLVQHTFAMALNHDLLRHDCDTGFRNSVCNEYVLFAQGVPGSY